MYYTLEGLETFSTRYTYERISCRGGGTAVTQMESLLFPRRGLAIWSLGATCMGFIVSRTEVNSNSPYGNSSKALTVLTINIPQNGYPVKKTRGNLWAKWK